MFFIPTTEKILDYLHCYRLARCFGNVSKAFCSLRFDGADKQIKWLKDYSIERHRGEHNLQLQDYVEQRISRLLKNQENIGIHKPTDDETKRTKALEAKLDQLKREYWAHERRMCRIGQRKPKGAYIREFNAQEKRRRRITARKKVQGNMTPAAVGMCRGLRGCFSRNCGCCGRPRYIDGKQQESHCTLDCACCIEHRGFERATEAESDLDSVYCRRQDNIATGDC